VIRLKANNCFSYFYRARLYIRKGEWKKALGDYSEAIRQDPSHYAYEYRGDAYRDFGDFEKANADYAEALRLAESDNHFARAGIYAKMGELDKAVKGYSEAIRRSDWDVASAYYHARGKLHQARGELNEAVADFTEAIRLSRGRDYDCGPYYSSLARLYEEKRDDVKVAAAWDDAVQAASSNIRQVPPGWGTLSLLARASYYSAKGDFQNALADYAEAITTDPKDVLAYCGRATAYCRADKSDEALADCNHAAELERRSDQPLLARGLVYLEKADYDKALADFDQASHAAARHADVQAQVRIGRAMALFLSGKGGMNKAREEYRLALRYDLFAEDSFLTSAGVTTQLMYNKLVDKLKRP
jgi:tetratricopeptide (TPR) repeat protein